MGDGAKSSSDTHFAAIELTAAQTDRLTELFQTLDSNLKKVVTLAEETKQNVIVLKAQQDEVIREQTAQSKKLEKIDGAIDSIEIKIDQVSNAVDAIRQAVAGATSLAATAFKEATGHEITEVTRLKKKAATAR